MLTKDLLKYTVRGDKIFPKYVKPQDADALSLAAFLIEAYGSSLGLTQAELEGKLDAHPKSSLPLFQGLNKLLEERCDMEGSDEQVADQRWLCFQASKALRAKGQLSIEEFQAAMAAEQGRAFERIQGELYGDLPEFRIIQKFEPITPADLIHRYNAAQIQGLILRARAIEITVKDKDTLRKRRLLQRLKFWRLLAEIDESDDTLSIALSGPLTIFDKSATYGGRLSNFFPYILLMNQWSLKAEIKLREKFLTLEVDSSRPIRSHYADFTGYLPPEFKEFVSIFNELPEEQRRNWEAIPGDDILNLGQQSYSVPDLSFRHPNGQKMHLELFHKWHERQLKQRVESLRTTAGGSLILGVAADLLAKDQVQELAGKSKGGALKVLTFKNFPTPKAILAYLS